MSKKLLNIDNNAKTVKGQKKGYMTAILYLAPADLAKDINVCPAASDGCKKACLNLAGRGRMNMVQKARIRKTLFFHYNKNEFMSNLHKEISSFIKTLYKCLREVFNDTFSKICRVRFIDFMQIIEYQSS